MRKTQKEPCDFCEGRLEPRRVNVVRGRGRKLAVIEHVPAMVCVRCGMRYYDSVVVKSMEQIIRRAKSAKRSIKVPVTEFEVVA